MATRSRIVQVGGRDIDVSAPQSRPGRTRGNVWGVSQPTISRAVSVLTPLLGKLLEPYVLTAEDLDDHTQYIVDGTLLPYWSWAEHAELHSGKHKTIGRNVQVACTLEGKLAWISDPVDGHRHDTYCLGEFEVQRTLTLGNWLGDKGYVGTGMIIPIKKPEGRELLDWENNSTRRSTRFATASSRPSRNSKHGASCTPTTAAPAPPSTPPSQPSSPYTSTPPPE